MKRAFDLAASVLGLLFLAPAFGVIALLIKLDSPGPVCFFAERVGLRGKLFKMFKFRTMYERLESYNGPRLTVDDDQRITSIGYWLRKTKVNELPQLWNVLIGEMSLVGPRPEDPAFVAEWPEPIRQDILSVRPGITSPASVIYRDEEKLIRGESFLQNYINSILPDKLRLDQLYVRHHTFISDLDVIFMTLLAILPKLRKQEFREKIFYSGPVYLFITRFLVRFLIDFLVAFGAIGLAGLIWRAGQPLHQGFLMMLTMALIAAGLLSILSWMFGLQRVAWRYASPVHVIDIGLLILVTNLVLLLGNRFWLTDIQLPLHFLVNFGLMAFIGLVAVRYQERLLTGLANRWVKLRNGNSGGLGERVLVVGAGAGGEMAVWMLHKCEHASVFSVVGFVDDDFRKHDVVMTGYPILGSTREIPELVEKKQIGLILFAISKISPANRQRILKICEKTDARVVLIPDLMQIFVEHNRGDWAEEVS